MKKTNLMKVILVLIVSAMLILSYTTIVNAADANTFEDITPTLDPNAGSSSGSTNANNANANSANTNALVSNSANTNTNNTNTNTNNSSVYANSNLPSTGIGESLPIALLVIVCAISAVYAYKKIKDYRNI